MRPGILVVIVLLAAGVTTPASAQTSSPPADDGNSHSDVRRDFNGDGRADLAIGVPGEDNSVGAVQVLYGGPNGLRGPADTWSQGVSGVPGNPETGDSFGQALTAG